jgi:hypothetical protein
MRTPAGKYRNTITEHGGQKFHSKLEAEYAQQLDLEWAEGGLLWYIRQVPFHVAGTITYRADYLVVRPSGVEVIDVKGYDTPHSKTKRAVVEDRYGIRIRVVTRKDIRRRQ